MDKQAQLPNTRRGTPDVGGWTSRTTVNIDGEQVNKLHTGTPQPTAHTARAAACPQTGTAARGPARPADLDPSDPRETTTTPKTLHGGADYLQNGGSTLSKLKDAVRSVLFNKGTRTDLHTDFTKRSISTLTKQPDPIDEI